MKRSLDIFQNGQPANKASLDMFCESFVAIKILVAPLVLLTLLVRIVSKVASANGSAIKISNFAMGFCVLVLAMTGCTDSKPKLHAEPNIELIQDMMESPALKAQDFDTFDRNKGSARVPPEGTVPIGFKPYPYPGNPDLAAKNLVNPLAKDFSPEVLKVGQQKYEIYCMVCHGPKGGGDGPVAVKMLVKPPALMTDKIRKLADGGIYHIISEGQGVMSSYASQLMNPRERWMIVNYVRNLQKMQPVTKDAGGGNQ
jgi:mono/diheme cytochrome c family protein